MVSNHNEPLEVAVISVILATQWPVHILGVHDPVLRTNSALFFHMTFATGIKVTFVCRHRSDIAQYSLLLRVHRVHRRITILLLPPSYEGRRHISVQPIPH